MTPIKKSLTALAAIVLAAFCALPVSAQDPDFKLGRNIEILINTMRELNYFYVEELDTDRLLQNAADGMMSELDPYTAFIPEEQVEDFEVLTTGKYGGIGSIIRQKGDWIYIAEPYKNSPADKAGFTIGDKIVAVDGVSAEKAGSPKVSAMLKGDPGTEVKVTLEKFDTGEHQTLTLTRERISMSGVPYYGFVNDSIGYIQHSDFTEDCSSDMRNALAELKNTGRLKGLILDYRGNGGGILQEAVKILSLFVPKGTEVVSMRGRMKESTASFTTETEPLDTTTPIVVLVNGGSASAAEIVAGALQDLDRAVVVGQRTFGKGLVQSTRGVGYNAYIKVTTAKYYIPSGRCIQAVDYAHRDEYGGVVSFPDSLVREYATANGRKVYDGGGVMPDVKIDPEYISRFTLITYGKGYIEDFAEMYAKKYRTPVDPRTFRLTDADYAWFTEFMQDKDVEYRSETSTALASLKEKAERERYADRIADAIAEIEKEMQDDKNGNLALYRDQISELIEDDIVLRYNYRRGVIEHNLMTDKEVASAGKLLADEAEYTRIITSQDTSRK